jgi:hypothetical protein
VCWDLWTWDHCVFSVYYWELRTLYAVVWSLECCIVYCVLLSTLLCYLLCWAYCVIKLCNIRGYPILIRYPMGMSTGIKFYSQVWSWARMSCTYGYCQEQAFALPDWLSSLELACLPIFIECGSFIGVFDAQGATNMLHWTLRGLLAAGPYIFLANEVNVSQQPWNPL